MGTASLESCRARQLLTVHSGHTRKNRTYCWRTSASVTLVSVPPHEYVTCGAVTTSLVQLTVPVNPQSRRTALDSADCRSSGGRSTFPWPARL